MDDVRPVVNGADVVHVEFGEQIAGNLQTAEAIEENIPFVRIAQAQGIGTEEHRRRHAARPVQRKRVHRLDNAVLDRVEQLKVANDFGRAERSESQFAAGLVGDAVGPGLENIDADTARPRGLNAPRRALGLGSPDHREADSA